MGARPIRAGRLRRSVTIEQPPTALDGYQQPIGDWTPFATNVPCSIEGVSGAESWRGLKVDAVTTHAVEMRYLDGLKTTMRLDWNGQKLNIVSVLDRDGYKHSMHLMCKETTNG